MRSMPALFVTISVSMFLVVSLCSVQMSLPNQSNQPHQARTAAEPEAIFSPLPDEVSNGTEVTLSAAGSTYAGGTIDHYNWAIFYHGVQKHWSDNSTTSYRFVKLGVYLIKLTVTTNDSKTATSWTAVYSIDDADNDGLPDWWEMHYFGNLTQTGDQDFDNDGYTNLQEYASDTDPTVKDPGPSFVAMLAENWYYLVIVAAVIVGAIVVLYPRMKKKQKAQVKKQIEAAIEIEKALEEDK